MNKKFTLIELLVVIAIIGILSSILIPSLSHARKKAYASLSISNMKQIGTAFVLYSVDNNDALPPSRYPTGTYDAWPEYVKQVLDLKNPQKVLVHPGVGFDDNVKWTYAATQAIMGIDSNNNFSDRISRKILDIEEPSRTHLLTESKLQSSTTGKWRITWGQATGDINAASVSETKFLDFPYLNSHHLLNGDFSVITRKFSQRAQITEPKWTGKGY